MPEAPTKFESNIPLKFVLDPHGYAAQNRYYTLRSVDGNYPLGINENRGSVSVTSLTNRKGRHNYQLAGAVNPETRKIAPIVSITAILAESDSHSPFTYAEFENFRDNYLRYVATGAGRTAQPPILNSITIGNATGTYFFNASIDPTTPTKLNFTAELSPHTGRGFGKRTYDRFKEHFVLETAKRLKIDPNDLEVVETLNIYERLVAGEIPGIRAKKAAALLRIFGSSGEIRKALADLVHYNSDAEIKSSRAYTETKAATQPTKALARSALTLAGQFLRGNPAFLK